MCLICFVSAVKSTKKNRSSLVHADTSLPSAVFLLFLLMNGIVPDLESSEASTELLLITLSSSFFLVTSAVAAAASSSSSSSWSEYWLKASTSSLKISSLIKPPSGTEIPSTQILRCGPQIQEKQQIWQIQILNESYSDVQRDRTFGTHLCPRGHHRNYQWVPPGRPRPVPGHHRPCMGCCEGRSHLRPTTRAERTNGTSKEKLTNIRRYIDPEVQKS